jgi:hypothetical protein
MLTVQARLGMVLALLGHYGPAKELLHEVAPALREYRCSTGAAGGVSLCSWGRQGHD